jgi:hypothetical protein
MDLVLRGEESPGVESKSTNDTADDLAERIQSVVPDAKKCLDAAQQRQKLMRIGSVEILLLPLALKFC